MTSPADSGKPNRHPPTRTAAASASTARRKKSSSAKSSTTTKRRTTTGSTQPARTSRSKRKKAVAKPAGPAVYASDVIGDDQATRPRGDTPILPNSTNSTPPDALALSPIESDLPMEHRPAQVLRLAEEAFAMTGSWVVFYRTLLAPGGVVDQLYETPEARRYFETTREFAELLEMVTAIRSQDDSSSGTHEPTRMITIRVPRSLHAATIRESEELELSINAYCVTKLLQPANPRFTPLELGKRRGRRPGPQLTLTKSKVKSKTRRSKT